MQDAVMKLYRCLVEIKMKAELKNGCGTSKGAGSRGVGSEGTIGSLFYTFTPILHRPGLKLLLMNVFSSDVH